MIKKCLQLTLESGTEGFLDEIMVTGWVSKGEGKTEDFIDFEPCTLMP